MEEKVLNMEYNINGEKYIITATKVNEDEVVIAVIVLMRTVNYLKLRML